MKKNRIIKIRFNLLKTQRCQHLLRLKIRKKKKGKQIWNKFLILKIQGQKLKQLQSLNRFKIDIN